MAPPKHPADRPAGGPDPLAQMNYGLEILKELREIRNVLRCLLITQGTPPVTNTTTGTMSNAAALINSLGVAIDQYKPFYKNDTDRRISIKVLCDFVTPGARFKFALDVGDDFHKIEELALSGIPPSGVETGHIILNKNQTLYINNAAQSDGSFISPTVNDKFRIQVYDITQFERMEWPMPEARQ